MRRRHLFASGYAGPVRWNSGGPGHHVHDHQFPGRHHLGNVYRGGGKTRHLADKLGGTLQNDILKEYIAQKEFIFPPEPSMRLVTDTIEFGTRRAAQMEHDFHFGLPHS